MAQEERTLIIMKPDCVQRNLLGEIIHRFERKGLRVVGLKMIQLEDVLLEDHYKHHVDKPFFAALREYMQSAPVVLAVLRGYHAVDAVRLLAGPTAGQEAPAGSIRGDYSLSIQSNIVHASDSIENANEEISRFFKDDELFDYEKPEHWFVFSDKRGNR